MIPPSGALSVFGIIAEQSIGTLFTAAIVPGITQMLSYFLVIALIVRLRPTIAPTGRPPPMIRVPGNRARPRVSISTDVQHTLTAVDGQYPRWRRCCNQTRGDEKMNGKAVVWLGSLCAALTWLGVSVAEDTVEPAEKPAASAAQPTAADISRRACINQCEIFNGSCNSEVRQARQECSKKAANSGRDPMTMRNNDYTYFCSYFRNPGRRGSAAADVRRESRPERPSRVSRRPCNTFLN